MNVTVLKLVTSLSSIGIATSLYNSFTLLPSGVNRINDELYLDIKTIGEKAICYQLELGK